MSRQLVSSNTPGERLASFSRAVRVGDMVFVSGTTASDESGATQHPGDAAAQTIYVLRKIESALAEVGATLADVVRTRVFVRNIEDSEAVARAHGNFFADIRPANTLLRGEPIDSEMLVEVEVDAVISPESASGRAGRLQTSRSDRGR
jgi:enamine deaminase RidA (YjgF/YER057c/UK114 family)